MKKGDRAMLLTNFKNGNVAFNSGHIVTIQNITAEVAIVNFKNEEDQSYYIGINVNELILLKESDLFGLVANDYVLCSYRVGKKLFLENSVATYNYGEIFTIKDITLALNEKDDIFTLVDSKNNELSLTGSNIDHVMIPYSEEFESQLGEEIKFSNEKNYHLVGARMKSIEGKVVIILEKLDGDKFRTYENNMGFITYHKNDLLPFDNTNGELFEYNVEYIVPKKYHVGKRFIALEKVEKNVLLNQYIKKDDMIEITNHNQININFHDDIYSILIGDNSMNLSVYELENFFKSEEDIMIEKRVPGKIISVDDSLNEEKIVEEFNTLFEALPYVKDTNEALPNVKNNDECLVKIHDVTINGYNFSIDSEIKINNRINIEEIDGFIKALNKLKTLLEDN